MSYPRFVPLVTVKKSGDDIVVLIRQRYSPRGLDPDFHKWPRRYRWRLAGIFSLKELKEEEKTNGRAG